MIQAIKQYVNHNILAQNEDLVRTWSDLKRQAIGVYNSSIKLTLNSILIIKDHSLPIL